ncbi:hypothetical protein F4813DRAFT_389297 [Daldinia decipiens]|uniref:uncharacterized protein n=1 Tax=Daldinia decipiens TaxID=326647 RepID=UPI0020C281E9|nr:uncharacterized protein F4813DRAFT_389297 [Daldinia decipiens]KAI1658035.1 hypothetical protein F4813DRAFT_389297 [Daldinia decipiens]
MRLPIFALAFAICKVAALPLQDQDSVTSLRILDGSVPASDDSSSSGPREPPNKNIGNMHARKSIHRHTSHHTAHEHMPRCVNAIMPNGAGETLADGKSTATGIGDLSTAALAIAIAALVI